MQKNLLVGNGINIQFGGSDYTNREILKRAIANISADKYSRLLPGISSKELLDTFEGLKDIVVNIGKRKPSEEFIFLLMEIQRIKDTYGVDSVIDDIALEDLFIALEFLWESNDSQDFKDTVHRGLQQILLDAIYNDGKIHTLDYGKNMSRFLKGYDNIFTINYDKNLERYTDKKVYHLHGDFETLSPIYDQKSSFSKANPDKCLASQIVDGFEHTFSNTIMSWYWLDKYGAWSENDVYGKEVFEEIDGKLDIIGISPCNDFQLFLTISNSALKNVTYYFKSDEDRSRIQGAIKKGVTLSSVDKLWLRISS